MNHNTSLNDEKYLESFRAHEIEAGDFHHREHLRIAYTLLAHNNVEESFSILKNSILGFLSHLGVDTSKYNETMTYAWLLAVFHFMVTSKSYSNFDDFIKRHELLLDQRIMYTHYSEALIKSEQAKEIFIEPDLEPIPRYR